MLIRRLGASHRDAAGSPASLSAIAASVSASVCFCIAGAELLAWLARRGLAAGPRRDPWTGPGSERSSVQSAISPYAASPSARLRRPLTAAGEPGGLSAADWLAIEVGRRC